MEANLHRSDGAPSRIRMQRADAARAFPERKSESNKSTYGYVALIGGSARYSGAIRLAEMANAAMRAGVGVVQLAVPRGLCASLRPLILESTLFPLGEGEDLRFVPAEFDALLAKNRLVAFGMGVGLTEQTEQAVAYLLQNADKTLLLDADGLNALARLGCDRLTETKSRVILTPHAMEFSRLCGKPVSEIAAAPIETAEDFAARYGVILLLKGATTVVTDGKTTYLVDRGCPGMATAGSGDVLSGILSAVCAAYRDDLLLAAAAGAYVNGYAGELAQRQFGAVSMLAGDTARSVAAAVQAIVSPEQE